jgi:hypothetical protein
MIIEVLLAPCGLNCVVCGIVFAHKGNDQKIKGKLSPV